MSLSTVLILLLLVALLFGGFGQWGINDPWGAPGWSPALVIILLLVILHFTGKL